MFRWFGVWLDWIVAVYLALYLGLELTMHVLKSQIHLVRQSLQAKDYGRRLFERRDLYGLACGWTG